MPRLTKPFVLTDPAKLVSLMEAREFSNRTLAAAAGVSKSKVSYLTSGQQLTVGYQTAARISTALGVQVEALFRPQERSHTATGP